MCCHSQPMEGRHHAPIRLTDYINHLTTIKTIYIRKFSNFNSEWTKTLYQTNLNNIAFLKGYRYDYLSAITPKTISYESPRKINVKFHKMTSYTWNFQKFTCVFIWLIKPSIHLIAQIIRTGASVFPRSSQHKLRWRRWGDREIRCVTTYCNHLVQSGLYSMRILKRLGDSQTAGFGFVQRFQQYFIFQDVSFGTGQCLSENLAKKEKFDDYIYYV